ncbi:MAG: Xaa-Pro aminopeptidase [Myxococcota bacterium]|jgi:Xaa-Pro aminopeptidase
MLPHPDFAAHRSALLAELGPDEAVLVFGGAPTLRNGDSEHRYRPDSDVFWLTGWTDPTVAVFLRPGDEPLTMFVRPKEREREVWEGWRPGPQGAQAEYGADVAFPYSELPTELPRLLQGVRALHYAFAADADNDVLLMGCVARAAKKAKRTGMITPETFHHPVKVVHDVRLKKLADEVSVMREAGRISAEAHIAAMRATRPGATEYAIESVLMDTFLRNGSSGAGYTPIVAGGANATVLHYVTNRDTLRDGDLLLVDAGCEVDYYTADITRTWPVSGRFSDVQRRVYSHVLAAQEAAIAAAVPGAAFTDLHDAAVRRLTEGKVELGLHHGPAEDRIEDGTFKRYYMHGTSHWLGLDVHDVGAYARDGAPRVLQPGMVLTVEPGLYIAADDDQAPEALRGIGIRIEDDVLVTAQAPVVLTDGVPKHPDAIEAVFAAC